MWSHYADEHRGFCIEWKLDSLPNDSALISSLYPMLYGEDRFDITKHIEMAAERRYPNPFIAIAAALYKSSSWEHEKEWRIVLPLGFGVESYNYQMPVPSSVLLGARISKDSEDEIVQDARIAGISVRRVRLADTGYTLEADS